MKLYRYIGASHTAVTLVDSSRINPLMDDTADPVTNYVAIDDTNGNEVDCGTNKNNVIVIIKNSNAVDDLIVTQKTYYTHAGIVVPDEVTTIQEDEEAIIGPVNHTAMLDSGVVRFDFSGTSPAGTMIALRVVATDV